MGGRTETLARNLEALGLDRTGSASPFATTRGWRTDWDQTWPALSAPTGSGQWIQLHSRRAPVDEARRHLEDSLGERPWPALVVLLCGGLGYALDALETIAPAATRVLVIEPIADAALALLARRDWTSWLTAGRLTLLVGPRYIGASDAWRLIDPSAPPLVVAHPVLARSHAEDVASARRVFDRVTFDAAANARAAREFAVPYLCNTLANLPFIAAAPGLRAFEGCAAGAPAVACAAGPSLNRNLAELAPRRDRVVLIAADTALKPVLAAGLEPDFVVALDPSPLNARHLMALPPLPRTWLVAEAALDGSALRAFEGRTLFFRVGDNDPWPWLQACRVDCALLPAWGSVLTAAFELAVRLGCDPVAFAGADLAYTGGQTYCRGTVYELDWARGVVEGQPLPRVWRRAIARRAVQETGDVAGSTVLTAPHLLAFRAWLAERVLLEPSRRVVNLTGAGLLAGEGIEQGSMDWLDTLPVASLRLHRSASAAAPAGREVLALELSRAITASEPIATWRARLGEGAGYDRLAPVLLRVRDALSEPPARWAEPAPAPVPREVAIAHLPEAVAVLRAARSGVPSPGWAVEGLRQSRSPGSPCGILAALMRHRRLLSAEGAGRPPGADDAADWERLLSRPSSAGVGELAAALAVAAGACLVSAGRAHASVAAPRGRLSTARPARRGGERDVRRLLLESCLLAMAAARQTVEPEWRRALAALDAVATASDESTDTLMRLACSTGDRSWRWAAGVPASALAGVIGGAALLSREGAQGRDPIVAAEHDGVRIVVRVSPTRRSAERLAGRLLAWVPHDVLTDRGLPRCLTLSRLDGRRALATPRGSLSSFIVDAAGTFTPAPAWRRPIVAEVHGPAGELAWSHESQPHLLFRETASGEEVAQPAPFQPYSMIWRNDREALWSSDTGLWAWRVGRPPERLVALPPSVIVTSDGRRVQLDPLPIVGGRLERLRLPTGWTFDLESGDVTERGLGQDGQSWSECRHRGLVARTFTDADVIEVGREGASRTLWLAWPLPRTAAWLDDCLVLNTAVGEVVRFSTLPELL